MDKPEEKSEKPPNLGSYFASASDDQFSNLIGSSQQNLESVTTEVESVEADTTVEANSDQNQTQDLLDTHETSNPTSEPASIVTALHRDSYELLHSTASGASLNALLHHEPGQKTLPPSHLSNTGDIAAETSRSDSPDTGIQMNIDKTCVTEDNRRSPALAEYFGTESSANDLNTPTEQKKNKDEFIESLAVGEESMRNDAWLPSDTTKHHLVSRVARPDSYTPNEQLLTRPGIVLRDPQVDPAREIAARRLTSPPPAAALTCSSVSTDIVGLNRLIEAKCYRAAIELSSRLLTKHGQGANQTGQPSLNTPESLQVWCTRFESLMLLEEFSIVEAELKAFGNLDNPDMYFEYYPSRYPGRRGSLIPFTMRLIHAELPLQLGHVTSSIKRSHHLMSVINRILYNLKNGFTEDGHTIEMTGPAREKSLSLWTSRKKQVLTITANCQVDMKDMFGAIESLRTIGDLESNAEGKAKAHSACGRLYIQLGDLSSAEREFNSATVELTSDDHPLAGYMTAVNKGLLECARSDYSAALSHFKSAVDIKSDDVTANTNMSVCLLYLGKLQEAINVMQKLSIDSAQAIVRSQAAMLNMSTLYELQMSDPTSAKLGLLRLMTASSSDSAPVQSLKLTL